MRRGRALRHPDRSAPRLGLRFAVGIGHLCQIKFWLMQFTELDCPLFKFFRLIRRTKRVELVAGYVVHRAAVHKRHPQPMRDALPVLVELVEEAVAQLLDPAISVVTIKPLISRYISKNDVC
jgi:hypothetical protein